MNAFAAIAVIASTATLTACGTSPEFVEEVAEPDEAVHLHAPGPEWSGAAVPERSHTVVGSWQGIGYQSNGTQWEMIVHINGTERGPCATVRYPTVGCAGYWECVGRPRADRLVATERITKGKGKCLDAEVSVALCKGGRGLSFYVEADDQTAMAELLPIR